MIPRSLSLAAATAAIVAAAPLRAQSGVNLKTTVTGEQVEAGENFELRLSALSDAGTPMPSSPRLSVPAGVTAHGPSVGTNQQVSIVNGRVEQRQGITASWVLSIEKPGTYRIGPASVEVNGARVNGEVVTVKVLPPGSTPPPSSRRRGFPFQPFDPWGGFPNLPGFPDLDFGDDDDLFDRLPPHPPELDIARAKDPVAFLDARVSKRRVVVGEQVTYSVYAYGGRGPFRESSPTEAPRPDFLSFPLLENGHTERQYRVAIGDQIWYAARVRELALFPIRSGQLTIGPMKMGFDGRSYSGRRGRGALMRASAPIQVEVVEPPVKGRPPGYQIGDVGDFRLSAEVEPREVLAGEAVAVSVRLEGTGNLPHKLKTPEQAGVRFHEPTTTEDIEPINGRIGGFRQFRYVVDLERAGDIDLGEITLPYYNPGSRSYRTARADLGTVTVRGNPAKKPAAAAPIAAEAPLDKLLALSEPRQTLGAVAPARARIADQPWFWPLLLLAPLSVLLTGAVTSGLTRLRNALERRRSREDTLAARALAEAEQAARAGRSVDAASALERSLLLAVEAVTGLKARGVLRAELGGRLEEQGLDGETSTEIVETLNAADTLRFTGSGGDETAAALVERGARLVKRLGRRGGRRRGSR